MDIDYQYLVGTLQEALAADGRVNALDLRIAVAGGRIHLAGEHTCYAFVGYMEGALQSGARVAKRLIAL